MLLIILVKSCMQLLLCQSCFSWKSWKFHPDVWNVFYLINIFIAQLILGHQDYRSVHSNMHYQNIWLIRKDSRVGLRSVILHDSWLLLPTAFPPKGEDNLKSNWKQAILKWSWVCRSNLGSFLRKRNGAQVSLSAPFLVYSNLCCVISYKVQGRLYRLRTWDACALEQRQIVLFPTIKMLIYWYRWNGRPFCQLVFTKWLRVIYLILMCPLWIELTFHFNGLKAGQGLLFLAVLSRRRSTAWAD